jgi:hypothetical protein
LRWMGSAGSTASGITASSPAPRARPALRSPASYSTSRHHQTMLTQSSQTMAARHAHAAVDIWSSSKRSNAGNNPARRQRQQHQPGSLCHDPAWPAPITCPSIPASANDPACRAHPQHRGFGQDQARWHPVALWNQPSTTSLSHQRILTSSRQSTALAPPESKIPIDHRLPTAGSCM